MTSSPSTERRQPLLLGEMPSKRGDEFYAFPLSGSPAVKLLRWAGIPWKPADGAAYWTLVERFDTMNAQERYAPKFDLEAARVRWTRYLLRGVPERQPVTVVCLGRNAQRTIGAESRCTCGGDAGVSGDSHSVGCPAYLGDWFHWREAGLLRYVAIPHPSGRNRLWNEEGAFERAGLVLREALFMAEHDPGPGHPVVQDGRVLAYEVDTPMPVRRF